MEELRVRTPSGNEGHETHKSQGMLVIAKALATSWLRDRITEYPYPLVSRWCQRFKVKYDSAEDWIFREARCT